MKRKVCIATATRADYGLLYQLIKQINDDNENFELQILVSGMHLSSEFGLTYKVIEKDGFFINKKIESLLSSDSALAISKSMALTHIGFAEAFEELKPDLLVVLGDRYEMLSVASAAMISRIPIAHIHGGETTEGSIDESIRHSITKMSHIHFTSTEEYRMRVVQLGEDPKSVFNFGSLGVENIRKLKLLEREEFEKLVNFKLNKRNLLVTFHPVTLEVGTAKEQFQNLLSVLDDLQDTNIIFTKPNADHDGRVIIRLIEEYVAKNTKNFSTKKAVVFDSLGQIGYLSAIKYVDAVVGNSSSGIIEVPSFKKPTINIGDRQRGRIFCDSVINCGVSCQEIKKAFEKIYSSDFQEKLRLVKNPYEQENTAYKIKEVIMKANLENILKKKFFNIPFSL